MSRPKIVLPPDRIKAAPEYIVSVAKVATKGKIPITLTNTPLISPPANPTAKAAPAPATADSYVVASGDNPYTIAKKLHVSYNALLTLNDIKDPTKIQIGQKLKVPKQK